MQKLVYHHCYGYSLLGYMTQ